MWSGAHTCYNLGYFTNEISLMNEPSLNDMRTMLLEVGKSPVILGLG